MTTVSGPPPTRGVSGAPPPRTAATTAVATVSGSSSGRTPVAHRTRYMNYQAQRSSAATASATAAAAPPRAPPLRTTVPPPPTRSSAAEVDAFPPLDKSRFNTNSTTTRTTTTTALQRQADEGIAKRRAELRRLKQSHSSANTTNAASAAARSRLGGGSIGMIGNHTTASSSSSSAVSMSRQTTIPPPAAVAALSVSSSSMGTLTPVILPSPRLPSTATITRRLDYDACDTTTDPHNNKNNSTASSSNNTTGKLSALPLSSTSLSSSIPSPPPPPPPQSQATNIVSGGMGTGSIIVEDYDQDDTNNYSAGHRKRTSEIFNVGKQHQQQIQQLQQQHRIASMTADTNMASKASLTVVGTSLNPFSPSGPDRHNPDAAAATTTTTTAANNNYRPMLDVILAESSRVIVAKDKKYMTVVPPLMIEPLLTLRHDQQQQQQPVPPPTSHQEQGEKKLSLKSIIKKPSPMTTTTTAVEKKSAVVQQQDSSSGKSTTVMSNINHNHDYDDTGDRIPENTMNVGSVDDDHDNNNNNNNEDHNDSNDDVSRLMVILERNEREKKMALENLLKMKQMLLFQQEQNAANPKSNINPSKDSSSNNNNNNNNNYASSLLHQFKDMVAIHGESAAGAWIAQQLDNTSSDSERGWQDGKGEGGRLSSSYPSSNGGGTNLRGDNNMLLSSIIPPLTPRSRSGSRPASPERGGGLGELLDKQGDILGGMGRSTRGKRMTTPLPKQFNKTIAGGSGSSSAEDGSGGDGKGTGGDSGRKISLVQESIEDDYLIKAATSIPNEYGTLLASYLVRRPYVRGMGEQLNRDDRTLNEKWSSYSHLTPNEEYQRSATALDPTSIDILAYIEADGSFFTLTGRSNARHSLLSSADIASTPGGGILDGERSYEEDASFDWVVFDDVEGTDRALGKVTYIDAEGNERDYWLDSIYEEALTTRESYCMSLLSTAYALKEVTGDGFFLMSSVKERNQQRQVTTLHSYEPTQLSPSNASTDNSIPLQHQPPISSTQPGQPVVRPNHVTQAPQQPAAVFNVNQDVQQQPELGETLERPTVATSTTKHPLPELKSCSVSPTKDDKHASSSKMQPEDIYEPADSALPYLVVTILSMLFSMIWFFVKIPVRIGSVIFSFWVFIVALRVLWLLLADDNGAWEMGAGVDFEYNMPGIY